MRLDGVVGTAFDGRREVDGDDGGFTDEDDLAFYSRLVFGEPLIEFGFEGTEAGGRAHAEWGAGGGGGGRRCGLGGCGWRGTLRWDELDSGSEDFARSRGGPGEDFELDVFVNGCVDVAAGGFIEPAGVAEFPGLEVSVFETPLGHLRDGPFSGEFVVGGTGNAGAVAIGEHVEGVHDLRVLELFATHFGVGDLIYPFLRDEGEEQGESE